MWTFKEWASKWLQIFNRYFLFVPAECLIEERDRALDKLGVLNQKIQEYMEMEKKYELLQKEKESILKDLQLAYRVIGK